MIICKTEQHATQSVRMKAYVCFVVCTALKTENALNHCKSRFMQAAQYLTICIQKEMNYSSLPYIYINIYIYILFKGIPFYVIRYMRALVKTIMNLRVK